MARSPSMESQSWTPREEGRKGGGIRRVGLGGYRGRWRGLAVSGPRERGSQRAAGLEKEMGQGKRGGEGLGLRAEPAGGFLPFLLFLFFQSLFQKDFEDD